MKHFLIISTLFLLAFSSCSKEDDERVETKESVRYYVKYEVNYTTFHTNANRVIKFATKDGI